MSRIRYFVIAAFMASVLCGCGQNLMSAERESETIWEVRKHTENAINKGDAKTLRGLFAEDPVFVICNGPILKGLQAIEKMHVEFFRENPGFKTEFKRRHISFASKDTAIETVSYVDRYPDRPPRYGGDTTVYVKVDGRWMIKYIRMHPSELSAEAEVSYSIEPPHEFELVAADEPAHVSEGLYQVGWIKAYIPNDESHVQMISVEMDEPDVNWTQWGLKKQDVNFDGYLDIGVCQHAGAKWGRFHWYLYEPEKVEFYTNALTKELSELTFADFKTDPQTKRIIITRFLGTELTEYSYQVVDGHIRLSRSRLLQK